MAEGREARIVLSAEDKTRAAFLSARRNLESLNAAAVGIVARFGAIGVAGVGLSSILQGISITGVLNVADDLGKLSQRTGIAVEDLSALRYAGKLAGVSYEELDGDLKKFNLNIAAGARGSKEQVDAFEKLGISQKFLRDNINDTKKVLDAVAEAFEGYNDGANKGALANAVGGKSFEKLIPLLNQGAKGLGDARAELEKFGGVITADMAKRAEEFNDNITKLGFAAEALKIQVAGGLVGDLVKLSSEFVEAAKNGDLLWEVLKKLASFSGKFTLLGQVAGAAGSLLDGLGINDTALQQAEREAKRLQNLITGVEATLQRDPSNPAQLKYLDTLRAKLAAVNDVAKAAPPVGAEGRRQLSGINAPRQKTDAPALSSGAAGPSVDEIAKLKAQLQQREQAIAQSLASELDTIRFTETYVEQVYRSGNTSLENSFKAQDELRRRNVEEIRRASDETIAVELEFQRKLPKPKDAAQKGRNDTEVEASNTRIQAAKAKAASAERELQQAADLSAVQRPEQREQAREQVARFNAELQDLVDGGKSRAAELADIAAKTREAEKQLVGNGVDPAVAQQQAQAFGRQLETLRQFNLAREEFAKITDRARDAEEALAIAQQTNGTGLIEAERELFALRTQELAQLDALIEKTRALAAANPQNDQIAEELRKLELNAARLKQVQNPTQVRADAAADNIGDAIANGLSRANTEGRKLKDTIKSIGLSVFDIFEREEITKPLAKQLANLFKTAEGGNPLTKFLGLGATGAGGSSGAPGFSLGNVFGAPQTAGIVQGEFKADGTSGVGGISGILPGEHDFGAILKQFTGLGTAAGTSADVLGKLPQVAAIPATTGLGTVATASLSADTALIGLAASAELAAEALLQVGGSGLANGLAGSSGVGSLGLGGLIGGGGGFGSGANFDNIDLALFLHEGGVAGQAGDPRPVPASAFSRAVRYHTGGKAGQAPDKVPPGHVQTVLQAGEELLGRSDPRHRDNGGLDAPMQQLSASGGIVVQRLASPVPGLAADEVPALLPRGVEVLTAGDPRHSANAEGAAALGGHADVLSTLGLLPALDSATAAAVQLQDDATLPQPGTDFAGAPRFHSGGVVGGAVRDWSAATRASVAASEPANGARGGDTINHVNLSGLRVESHGAMDRMAEERSAQRIAMKAQRYIGRRGA